MPAASIGVDWGTSSLRAFLFDDTGDVLETRARPWGIRSLPANGFEGTIADVCDGWPPGPIIASGMVGSRQGWHEVAYVDAPAGIASLADHVTTFNTRGGRALSIVPGVRDASGPDVMRGEETEIMGALALRPELAAHSQLVLPGTHSKWVDVRGAAITHFRTVMTGELYAVLTHHSILGAMVPANAQPETDGAAFDDGVRTTQAAGAAGVLTRLFSARARVLDGRLEPAAVPSYISGLLIGEEWRAMLASGWLHAGQPPVLVGDVRQCALYQRAATAFDLPEPRSLSHAAARGLWQIHAALSDRAARAMPAPVEGHA